MLQNKTLEELMEMMEEHRKQEIAFCYPDIEGRHIGIGRLSEKQKEIARIFNIAMSSLDAVVRIAAIDALMAYGIQAIEPITRIIESNESDNNVKQHGLRAIQAIRAIYR